MPDAIHETQQKRQHRARRRRRAALRAVCATAPTAIVLTQSAGPAAAHYVYSKALLYHNADHCVGGRAEISHGGGGGYHKSDVYSWRQFWTPYGVMGCPTQTANNPKPAGYLAVRMEGWKKSGSTWAICTATSSQSGYMYNPNNNTHHYSIFYNNGQYGPCGGGTYGTTTHAYTLNGTWQGGAIWSGEHGGMASRGGK